LLASQCEGLDAVAGLRQVAHLDWSGTPRPAAGDCFPLQGSHKLLMDHPLIGGHHSLPCRLRSRLARMTETVRRPDCSSRTSAGQARVLVPESPLILSP
jgi:hypothetical protein